MPTNSRSRLVAIARREFEQRASKPSEIPAAKRFRSVKLQLAKFDPTWDRKRGEAMRLTGVLLSEGDDAMQARVCETSATAKTYAVAVSWLSREAEHLRKCSKLHEMAVARLTAVLARCAEGTSAT